MVKIIENKPNLIADYFNGNAHVKLYEDGTRIIETEDDEFRLNYPLNMDVTITHRCDHGCKFCYLNCTSDGKHADILKPSFLDTLHAGTELAINLNDLSHPQLSKFLVRMRDKGVFVNGTINQDHFMKYYKVLEGLCKSKCLWGLGISLTKATPEFVQLAKRFSNAVIHVINGILQPKDIEVLRDNGLKLLVLGYKNVGRGEEYEVDNEITIRMRQRYLYDMLPSMINHFDVISFDNLAIQQLDAKRLVNSEQWSELFQGEEGTSTFAVDMVKGVFSLNSMVVDPSRLYPIMDDVESMWQVIQDERVA